MGLFDRLLKGKKPDYGLLEEILNRPSSNSGGYSGSSGHGCESYDMMTTRKDAGLDAAIRAMEFPGDSLTTDQYNQFYNYGMWDK